MAGISEIYNKALYHTASLSSLDNHDRDQNEFYPDGKTSIPIINPNLDVERIQKEWLGQIAPPPTTTAFLPKTNSNNNKQNALGAPGVVVVDDILSPEAMEEIRNVLLESTVWYQTKMPLKFGGYVGAYIDDGLYDRILLKLAFELHKAFPLIMKDHPLRYLWAYKYDSEYTGINTHADQAAVNVNLWLAPDDANLDKESGGLVVFTTKPPSDWDFERYNADTEYIQKFISGSANVTIPHKQNRAVIFDSALFHHTDKFRFKKGYENRRINLTLLYGTMQREDTKGERAAVTTTSVQEEL